METELLAKGGGNRMRLLLFILVLTSGCCTEPCSLKDSLSKIADIELRMEKLSELVRHNKSRLDGNARILKGLQRGEFNKNDFYRTLSHRSPGFLKDGEIVYEDKKHDCVIINLGAWHGLLEKTVFKIYEVLPNTRRVHKGVLKVTGLGGDFSICKIMPTVNQTNPVVKGDLIWNKFFESKVRKFSEPKAKKTFVFVGLSEWNNPKFDRRSMEKLIVKNGYCVKEEVESDTDYVILGFDHTKSKQWPNVIKYKIEIVTHEILREFMFDD
jgi:NAD-dependent DNA ligase